jgi:hypothetical protein
MSTARLRLCGGGATERLPDWNDLQAKLGRSYVAGKLDGKFATRADGQAAVHLRVNASLPDRSDPRATV